MKYVGFFKNLYFFSNFRSVWWLRLTSASAKNALLPSSQGLAYLPNININCKLSKASLSFFKFSICLFCIQTLYKNTNIFKLFTRRQALQMMLLKLLQTKYNIQRNSKLLKKVQCPSASKSYFLSENKKIFSLQPKFLL